MILDVVMGRITLVPSKYGSITMQYYVIIGFNPEPRNQFFCIWGISMQLIGNLRVNWGIVVSMNKGNDVFMEPTLCCTQTSRETPELVDTRRNPN